jgi:hypothetical protein
MKNEKGETNSKHAFEPGKNNSYTVLYRGRKQHGNVQLQKAHKSSVFWLRASFFFTKNTSNKEVALPIEAECLHMIFTLKLVVSRQKQAN